MTARRISVCARECSVLLLCLLTTGCIDSGSSTRAVGEFAFERVEVAVESAEVVTARLVAEGESVAAGQPIIEQDTALAAARLAEAQAEASRRLAALEELRAGTRSEQLDAVRAEVDGAIKEQEFRIAAWNRVSTLARRDLAPQESLDEARAARDAAVAALAAVRARLRELEAGPRPESIRQAEAGLRGARAVVRQREIALERLTVTAPVPGILDRYLLEVGERPAAGQVAAIVLSGPRPYARVYVPAAIRPAVAQGQGALLYVDGIDRPLEGRVRWISDEAAFTPYFALTQHDRSRLSYLAKVDVVGDAIVLPDGVPVEVEFTGGSRIAARP